MQRNHPETRRLSPRFGLDVVGVDLRESLDADTAAWLRRSLAEESVLRFRGQVLSAEQQVAVLSSFGEVTPMGNGAEYAYISNKEQDGGAPFGRLAFHSDFMWAPKAVEITSLYGAKLESPAEATYFASTIAAYAALPQGLKQRVTGLQAEHTNDAMDYRRGEIDPEVVRIQRPNPVCTVRPVVMPHPVTGVPILCVSEMMTKTITDLPLEESEALLAELFERLYHQDNLFEQEWEPGDLVVWDNFGVQHARPNVAPVGATRTLRKVNVGGMTVPRVFGYSTGESPE